MPSRSISSLPMTITPEISFGQSPENFFTIFVSEYQFDAASKFFQLRLEFQIDRWHQGKNQLIQSASECLPNRHNSMIKWTRIAVGRFFPPCELNQSISLVHCLRHFAFPRFNRRRIRRNFCFAADVQCRFDILICRECKLPCIRATRHSLSNQSGRRTNWLQA